MRVLSFNAGYFLGYRAQREWLRRPHRLVLANAAVERAGMETLVDLLDEERPDVAAVQEVDLGSPRSRVDGQHRALLDRLRDRGLAYEARADGKYGPDTAFGGLPVFRHMSNAVLYRDGTARARYLSHGTKRLVHVVERDGPTVVSVHLSKTNGTRAKQLAELADVASSYRSVVLTGDFNVKNPGEFEPLTDGLGFDLHAPGKTFSTAHPTFAYDVFLTSPGLSVSRCEVLDDVTSSDHFPVIATVAVE